MSNVFTYPSNSATHYINPDDSLYIGAIKRARLFLDGGNDGDVIYCASYLGGGTRMSGLPERTPEKALEHVSKFRGYYGVASGTGTEGYPNYLSVWNQPFIYAYFHLIKFRITNAFPSASGTLRIEARRDSSSHPSPIPSFPATDTHGMGNASFKYTDTYSRQFDLLGFDTSVAGEWGNYLNFADNGGTRFYLKVIDEQTLEVYTDSSYTTPVNIGPSGLNWSAYTSGGFAVISQTGQLGSFQLLSATYYDQGNVRMTAYDADYRSGYGNSVNNDFGADIVGARPGFYVSSSSTSSTTFDSNPPIDYLSTPSWQLNSQYNPDVTITCSGDGSPLTQVGNNGCVTGVSFNVELGGLMGAGGTASSPFANYSQCAIQVVNNTSDPLAGYNFSVSNVTQASPAVVTFANSILDQSSDSNVEAMKVFMDIGGMTELNGKMVYLKQTAHNSAELYEDAAYTTPVDSTGYTAYTSGGYMQDYDNNDFFPIGDNFYGRSSPSEFQKFAPTGVDYTNAGSYDQIWPRVVSPAKMDIQLIHPTRKTYGQDLTRYTNSTGAYGYRLSLTYNNISKEAWQEFDTFIKQMRGASSPFRFYYDSNTDNGGYKVFDTDQNTLDIWGAVDARLARNVNPGDTQIYLTGFKVGSGIGTNDRIVSKTGDVFFGAHSYRDSFTFNNVAFAGGEYETNEYGEAIIRFTHPLKNTVYALNNAIQPATWTSFQCMLSDDEIEYDWHPIGNFVSFKVDMDVV